jgi:hypothetical protein
MNTLMRAESILGGLFTGGMIGFLWHPAGVALALAAATVTIISLREE